MSRLGGRESVTILRAQTSADPYSQLAALDWSLAPTQTVITGCTIQPGVSQEYLIGRDFIEVNFTVFLPAGSDVTALDRVQYNGTVYEVFGQPERWSYSPSGRLDYVMVFLKQRSG